MEKTEDKINRFIDALARRKDPTLNKFFAEVLEAISPLLDGSDAIKCEILELENNRLKRLLALFTDVDYYDVDDTTVDVLYNFSRKQGRFYSHDAFYDDYQNVENIRHLDKGAKFSFDRTKLNEQLEKLLL